MILGDPKMLAKTVRSIGCVVEWLERRDCDWHGLRSKSTRAIVLYL